MRSVAPPRSPARRFEGRSDLVSIVAPSPDGRRDGNFSTYRMSAVDPRTRPGRRSTERGAEADGSPLKPQNGSSADPVPSAASQDEKNHLGPKLHSGPVASTRCAGWEPRPRPPEQPSKSRWLFIGALETGSGRGASFGRRSSAFGEAAPGLGEWTEDWVLCRSDRLEASRSLGRRGPICHGQTAGSRLWVRSRGRRPAARPVAAAERPLRWKRLFGVYRRLAGSPSE